MRLSTLTICTTIVATGLLMAQEKAIDTMAFLFSLAYFYTGLGSLGWTSGISK